MKNFFILSITLVILSCSKTESLPEVSYLFPNADNYKVEVGGEVTNTGGDNKTTRGVCWSKQPNPSTNDFYIQDDDKGLGTYTISIGHLLENNTTYYLRAYAENKLGKVYSEEISFSTLKHPIINAYGCVQCDGAEVGTEVIIDNQNYLVVDRTSLEDAINNGDDLNKLCLSQVTNLNSLFFENSTFNADLNTWDVSNVEDFGAMFYGATNFNGDISNWEINPGSNVSMYGMFTQATNFNCDISNWSVQRVYLMKRMFLDAANFNQNLSGWCVQTISSEPLDFSTNSSLTSTNMPIWGTCP